MSKDKPTQMEITTKLARELQEFFVGTYAEGAIESALKTDNSELLLLTVNHFDNLRYQILEAENASA